MKKLYSPNGSVETPRELFLSQSRRDISHRREIFMAWRMPRSSMISSLPAGMAKARTCLQRQRARKNRFERETDLAVQALDLLALAAAGVCQAAEDLRSLQAVLRRAERGER
jgi:hypothetical protein